MTVYNIKYLDIYEELGALIQSNVTDILAGRTGKWIFPDFPNTDTHLPQITIKLENPVYENNSTGDFLDEEYDSSDNIYKEYFYKKATATVHIYAVTGKRQEIRLTLDNVDRIFSNKILNLYLTNLVKDVLLTKRPLLLTTFSGFKVEDVSMPFEQNKDMWASDIRCTIKYRDTWVNEYQDGDLIASYSLTTNIQQ